MQDCAQRGRHSRAVASSPLGLLSRHRGRAGREHPRQVRPCHSQSRGIETGPGRASEPVDPSKPCRAHVCFRRGTDPIRGAVAGQTLRKPCHSRRQTLLERGERLKHCPRGRQSPSGVDGRLVQTLSWPPPMSHPFKHHLSSIDPTPTTLLESLQSFKIAQNRTATLPCSMGLPHPSARPHFNSPPLGAPTSQGLETRTNCEIHLSRVQRGPDIDLTRPPYGCNRP